MLSLAALPRVTLSVPLGHSRWLPFLALRLTGGAHMGRSTTTSVHHISCANPFREFEKQGFGIFFLAGVYFP